MALPIGWWIWAGSPVVASETNDAGLGNRELQNMASLMSSYDLMITDRAFRSLREKLNILCEWTKAKINLLQIGKNKKTRRFQLKEVYWNIY